MAVRVCNERNAITDFCPICRSKFSIGVGIGHWLFVVRDNWFVRGPLLAEQLSRWYRRLLANDTTLESKPRYLIGEVADKLAGLFVRIQPGQEICSVCGRQSDMADPDISDLPMVMYLTVSAFPVELVTMPVFDCMSALNLGRCSLCWYPCRSTLCQYCKTILTE